MELHTVQFEVKPGTVVDVKFATQGNAIMVLDPPRQLFIRGNIPEDRLKRISLEMCAACHLPPVGIEWALVSSKRRDNWIHGWRLRKLNQGEAPTLENLQDGEWFRMTPQDAKAMFGEAWPHPA